MTALRDYQQAMVVAIRAAWQGGKNRVLGVLPTGGGKTEVAIALAGSIVSTEQRILVVVERKVLCHQWWHRLRRSGIGHVGLIQGDSTIGLSAPVLVGTIQSLRARGVPEDIGLLILDEAHVWHSAHDTLLAGIGGAAVLGLTATPLRKGLAQRFDTVVVGAPMRSLINLGYLVKPRYFSPPPGAIEKALASVPVYQGDYAVAALSRVMRGKAIMGDVVGEWLRRAQGRPTIAFAVDKSHARELAAQFIAAGVSADVMLDDTDDDERVDIVRRFEVREVAVLCSVGVLAIGFDSPMASCVVMARPTCSLSLYIQQAGRVLRPCSGKVDALVLDHAANVQMHGRLEDFDPTLDPKTDGARVESKSRKARSSVWRCQSCGAINDATGVACIECGETRTHQSTVIVLDGDLRDADSSEKHLRAGPGRQEAIQFLAMALWYASAKQRSAGWAFYATVRRFGFTKDQAREWLPAPWNPPRPMLPDDAASRWLRADLQRACIARRKARKGSKGRGAAALP